MNRFFDPKTSNNNSDSMADERLYAPATARNRDVLLDVFLAHIAKNGALVEVASGTGEHAAHIANHMKPLYWQPSDIEAEKLHSINAWAQAIGAENILPAQHFNVLEQSFADLKLPAPLTTVSAINLIHIAPWSVAEALVRKAAGALTTDGALFLYGPYKRGGDHTSPSNESFDQSLKSRDATWGVRDLEAVSTLAIGHGFREPVVIEMPANNLSVIFKKN